MNTKTTRKDGTAVLTIIDMQPQAFQTSQKSETIAGVLRLVAKAIERNWPVILVEFYAHGPTDERITEALRGYPLCWREFKFSEDGSEEIWEACVEHELPGDRFVICGVNTHACVKDTVFGMARLMPDSAIEIIQDACNCDTGWGWDEFFLPNENVVLRSTCPN